MSSYKFTAHQRHAVFTVHGEKCYLCNKPIDLLSMQVDHIIPESLLGDPDELRRVLQSLGRPASFNVNSFENWLPACGPCNNAKRDRVFDPSLSVQMALQCAAEKADKARISEQEVITSREISKSLNVLERLAAGAPLKEPVRSRLRALVVDADHLRAEEMRGTALRVTPLYEVLSDNGLITLVKGPYGIGGGPSDTSTPFICSTCGCSAWNGARCVVCGRMDDGD